MGIKQGCLIIMGLGLALIFCSVAEAKITRSYINKRTVRVVKSNGGHGSGVYLQPNYILSAGHVCSGGIKHITTYKHTYRKVTIVAYNDPEITDEPDLCVLRVPGMKIKALKNIRLAKSSYVTSSIGPIYYAGFPGRSYVIRRGRINGEQTVGGIRVIELDNVASPGISGGGVYTKSGALVGIIVMMRLTGPFKNEGLALAEPVESIRKFLNAKLWNKVKK